jgi:hypothetical protein
MACSFNVIGEFMLNPNGTFKLDQNGQMIPQVLDDGARHHNNTLFAALESSEWGQKATLNQEPNLSWIRNKPGWNPSDWNYLDDPSNHQYYNTTLNPNLYQFYIHF